MNTGSYLLHLMSVLGQWPDLAFFVELALKAMVLMLITLVPGLLLRKAAAAQQHLLWCLCILTLCCLPVFIGLLPGVQVYISVTDSSADAAPAPAAGIWLLEHVDRWWPPLLNIYLAGLFLLLAWTVCGLVRMLLLSRQARPSTNPVARQVLSDLLEAELSDARVSLREHPALRSPLSWGLLQPHIILPTDSDEWSREKMRHVLLHELHHILRLDWLSHLAGCYVRAVYWYNPLAWFVTRRMSELAEQACDDAVLLDNSSQTAYAGDLVAVARAATSAGRPRHLAQALAESFLGSRIMAILDTDRVRTRNDSAGVVRGLLVAFSLVAALASLTLGPTPDFDGIGSSMSRYVTVSSLPPEANVREPERMVVNALPTRMTLSHNLPPLETIYVQTSPPVVNAATSRTRVLLPVVELQEVAGASASNALHLLHKSFPVYPPLAERQGIEGHITVEYDITAQGDVINRKIIDARPRRIFDQSALKAIGNYRYEPPKVNGVPVGIKGLRTRFVYQLNPDPG